MPRGQPDFGVYAVKDVTASISDMGEVAARLGSIVTYDKRGDVVEFDNFEEPVLRWEFAGSTAAEYGILSSASVKSGSQAVKLHTGAVAGREAQLSRKIPILFLQSLGIEVSFSALSLDCSFSFYLVYYDGTTSHHAEVLIDPTAAKMYVRLDGINFQEVATTRFIAPIEFHFRTVKLVVDLVTGYFKRVLLDENEYDISTIPYFSIGSPHPPYLYLVIIIKTLTTTGGDCYIDDFILTQAEP